MDAANLQPDQVEAVVVKGTFRRDPALGQKVLLCPGQRIVVGAEEFAEGKVMGIFAAADEVAAVRVEQERTASVEEQERLARERVAAQSKEFRLASDQRAAEAAKGRARIAAVEAERFQELANKAKAHAEGRAYVAPVKTGPAPETLVSAIALRGFKHLDPVSGRGVLLASGAEFRVDRDAYTALWEKGVACSLEEWESRQATAEVQAQHDAADRLALLREHLQREPSERDVADWSRIALEQLPAALAAVKASQDEWAARKASAAEVREQAARSFAIAGERRRSWAAETVKAEKARRRTQPDDAA